MHRLGGAPWVLDGKWSGGKRLGKALHRFTVGSSAAPPAGRLNCPQGDLPDQLPFSHLPYGEVPPFHSSYPVPLDLGIELCRRLERGYRFDWIRGSTLTP